MSKNRKIPFGYMMENGEITTEPTESCAVIKIFDEYLAGKSLLDIANMMQAEGISYHPDEKNAWNRNMIKRILENEKYLGTNKYPQLVDKARFDRANRIKLSKATNLCIAPEDIKEIRKITICSECRKKLYRNQNGTWNCKYPHCNGFSHIVTDQMVISAVLNMLNSAIANPSLLDADGQLSIYTPNANISKQKNEIDRLRESADIDYERIKTEVIRLAEIKYDCCSYDEVPQKTLYLKEQLAGREQLSSLDIELLKMLAKHILVSHYAIISLEMINGVRLINNTERKDATENECNNNTAKASNSCGWQE